MNSKLGKPNIPITDADPTAPIPKMTFPTLQASHCSMSFEDWWNDHENGCPTLVLHNDEQFARAVWNAALADLRNNLRSELAAVTEHRDRLAVVLQNIRSGYGGQIPISTCDCGDCEFLITIDNALQYITKPN